MDTQERTKEISRFIILIPHRDALKGFDEFRAKLFAAGYSGAYSFPLASPLARVSRPFSREELKELGRNMRNLTKEQDGKILSCGTALAAEAGPCPCGKWSFFGPLLNLPAKEGFFPGTVKDKILHTLLPPLLCAAIVDSGENPAGKKLISEEIPVLSFRAASLANLAIRPLAAGKSAYSFEWRIGPPVWLPKYNAKP